MYFARMSGPTPADAHVLVGWPAVAVELPQPTRVGPVLTGSEVTAAVGADFRARNAVVLWIFRVIVTVAIVFDVFLVEYFQTSSISLRVWNATESHQTLSVGGIIATGIVCYLLRQSWPDAVFMGLLGGHLFTHQ